MIPSTGALSTEFPIPSPTLTAAATPMPSNAPVTSAPSSPTATTQSCGPFDGWVLYTVRPNDTLFGLSLVLDVTVSDLQYANCLGDTTNIQTGQRIFVPFVPPLIPIVIPTQTQVPVLPSATNTQPPEPSPTTLPPSATPPAPTETLIPASPTPDNDSTPTPVPPPPTPVPSDTPARTNDDDYASTNLEKRLVSHVVTLPN